MKSKSRYGIKVKFSCKLCTINYFETVEDYIEHKREDHFTEFRKAKCFIILEEKSFPVDSYYENKNKSAALELESDSRSHSQSSTTALKKKEIESNDADVILISDPISTKSSDDRLRLIPPSSSPFPSNEGDETEPLIEYETHGYTYLNPFTQISSENKNCPSDTIIPSNVDGDGRNSPEPSYFHPKSELVVFEPQIQEEESEKNMGTETEPVSTVSVGGVEINQNFTPNLDHQSTDFQCKLCLKKFNSEPERKIHVNICLLYHPNRNSYCAECNQLFSSGSMLNRHRSNFHSSKPAPNSEEIQETENVSSTSTLYYSELEPQVQVALTDVEEVQNPASHDQYYSELEGAEEPEEEYILGVSDDNDDREISAPPPTPPPSKKARSNRRPKIAQTQNEITSDGAGAGGLYPKPPFSYSNLIALALKNSKTGSLKVAQIYKFISYNFPHYVASGPRTWKSSLRTTLSLTRYFGKIEQPLSVNGVQSIQTGCRWVVDPSVVQKMDEEIRRLFQNNPETILAMRNPENSERIQRGELVGDLEGSDDDDDQDDDLSVITFKPKSQLTRRSRGSSSTASAADSSVSVASETVPSAAASKSSNSAFILSQQHLHTVLNLPPDPPENIQVKSEVSAEVTSASDFCEIISVQGNYLS